MHCHIPFERRHVPQPIYIGFDAPPRPRRQWNWWAFFGFPISILGILTAGVLAPVALIFNLVAMRRRPRRLATAGTVISLLGTVMFAGLVVAAASHARHEENRREARSLARAVKAQVNETREVLATVAKEFSRYRDQHQGHLPSWVDANMVTVSYADAWNTPLRFDAEHDHALLRSAGPDQQFDTRDDVIERIDGVALRTVSAEVPVDVESDQ